MALFDVSRRITEGNALPYDDDCVLICRTPGGNVTVKCDAGVSRADAARVFAALAAGLRLPYPAGPADAQVAQEKLASHGKAGTAFISAVGADSYAGHGASGDASGAEQGAPGGNATAHGVSGYGTSGRDLGTRRPGSTPADRTQPSVSTVSTTPGHREFSEAKVPEGLVEDIVRWQDGFTAYQLTSGGWWWVRWRSDTGERWGLSGPLMGAVACRRGPFDNFDETLRSLTFARAQDR